MTLGLQESRMRRRRQRRWAALKWLLVFAALVAAGVFAYETGSQLARIEVIRLEERVDELSAQIETVEREKIEFSARLRETQDALEDWRARYRAEVPSGEQARLLEQVQGRLDEGVPAARLDFVIANARPERNCESEPVTRRFIVQTPLSTGASDSVSFAENSITLSARGVSATDSEGRTEAWFDADAPVTVRFAELGGNSDEAEGPLPLHHSIVIDDVEHRFTVRPGDTRGFAQATWQRCDYP